MDESTVYSVNTPMIVEASAGSGKTTLLVDKYISILLYLTAFQNRSPFESVREIVALTYTRKAAEEMKDRIRKKARESINPSYLKQSIERLALYSGVDPGASDSLVSKIISQKETLLGALSYASISTIHSFALKILKEHPVEAKLDPSAAPNDDITFKDALFPALRFLIDSRDAGLSCLIKLMGFEKTESMVEELLEAADSYGFKALYDMAGRSGYFDYREVPDEAAWLESRIKPRLRSLLQAMETARPEIRKTGLAGLDNTIVNIRSALRIDNLPDLYHADFYYGAASRVVKDAADPEYKFIASEMNKYAFPFLWGVFESVFNNYSKLKRERKEISFSDIETILLDSISRDAGFAAEIKKNIGYILIDEYQDTSFLQKEIFDSLIYDGKGGLSMIPFIVGDPKQSIYGFRNANIGIFEKTRLEFLGLQGGFKTPVHRELDFNYRSGKRLVGDFNDIFSDLFNGEHTEYRAQEAGNNSETEREGVYFIPAEGTKTEEILKNSFAKAAFLIADMVGSGEYKPGDFMVLVRKKTKLHLLRESFSDILGKRGIPYFHADSSDILETREIQDIIIYLQALERPESNFYFLPLMKSPFFRKSDPEILACIREYPVLYDALNAGTSEEMDLFNEIRLKKNRISIADLAEEIIGRSGYFAFLSSIPDKKEATTNVLVFLDYLRRLQTIEMFNLTDFLYYIQEYGVSLSKPQVIGEKSDVVRVMTVHASKGLESRVVIYIASSPGQGNPAGTGFIISRGAEERRIGMRLIKPDVNFCELDIASRLAGSLEEKRLAYVTFTRAKKLFYYIGTGGKDGWKSFIDPGKGFALKRAASIPAGAAVTEDAGKGKESFPGASRQYVILKENASAAHYLKFPRVITVTQLLDIEFLEKAFKKRYIEKSFPIEEALGEIAFSGEAGDLTRPVDEGTFLHRVFQSASKNGFEEFIDKAIAKEARSGESGGFAAKRGSVMRKALAFYNSGFYESIYAGSRKRYNEWEIDFNFNFEGLPVLIKAVLDCYIENGKDGGIIVDYKLSANSNIRRYARQVNYYAYFLNELGYPADELYIYDIDRGVEIPVPKDTGGMNELIGRHLAVMKEIYSVVRQ